MTAWIGGRALHVTRHAIVRYRDRVRPELGLEDAGRELVGLIEQAGGTDQCFPKWARGLANVSVHADEYISIEERLLLPVVRSVVTTCLSWRSVGPTIRWKGRAA